MVKKKDKERGKDDSTRHGKKRTKCEIWSRAVGYLRPVEQWHEGKQQEFKDTIVELREQSVYAFGHSSEVGSGHIADLCEGRS